MPRRSQASSGSALQDLIEGDFPPWLQGPSKDDCYWCRACWSWADDSHLGGGPHQNKSKQGFLDEAGEWWASQPASMTAASSHVRDESLQDAGLLDGVTVMEEKAKKAKHEDEEEDEVSHGLEGFGLKKLLALPEIPAWLQGPAADGSWFCRLCGNWADNQHLTAAKGKHQKRLNNGFGEVERAGNWYLGMAWEDMTSKCKVRDLKLYKDGKLRKKHVAALLSSTDESSSESEPRPSQQPRPSRQQPRPSRQPRIEAGASSKASASAPKMPKPFLKEIGGKRQKQ